MRRGHLHLLPVLRDAELHVLHKEPHFCALPHKMPRPWLHDERRVGTRSTPWPALLRLPHVPRTCAAIRIDGSARFTIRPRRCCRRLRQRRRRLRRISKGLSITVAIPVRRLLPPLSARRIAPSVLSRGAAKRAVTSATRRARIMLSACRKANATIGGPTRLRLAAQSSRRT